MKVFDQNFSAGFSFPVIFTRDVFGIDNPAFPSVLSGTGQKNRILLVLDSGVFDSSPGLIEKVEKFSDNHRNIMEFVSSPYIMKGGEACKNDKGEVNKILELISNNHLCRHSFILVIGGGAVLDAAGYAAAMAHRGIRLIRMPSTTLAQNDSGIGVKNGINAFGRKNFIGTFAPPFAVINDFNFLDTLPLRYKRAGIAEAVKVALIRDKSFFDFLYKERQALAAFDPDVMEYMIVRCAEHHIEHIRSSGDPFEQGSSRPLDFGHWSAHKIEELTSGDVLHGEAVAIGIALDALYSHYAGFISEIELQRILRLLRDTGFDLYHWSLGWMDIDNALKEFQEHLGGRLTLPLLQGIGRMTEAYEADTVLLKKCVNILATAYKEKENRDEQGELPDAGKRDSGKIFP